LGVKILKFFDEDLGSGMETVRIRDPGWKKVGSGIRDKHPGSATLSIRRLFTYRKSKSRHFRDNNNGKGWENVEYFVVLPIKTGKGMFFFKTSFNINH
jgi:hypothetical protein